MEDRRARKKFIVTRENLILDEIYNQAFLLTLKVHFGDSDLILE